MVKEGVKKVGSKAFTRSYNLTKVTVPESVEEIDWLAFGDCKRLAEVSMASTVKKIGVKQRV